MHIYTYLHIITIKQHVHFMKRGKLGLREIDKPEMLELKRCTVWMKTQGFQL